MDIFLPRHASYDFRVLVSENADDCSTLSCLVQGPGGVLDFLCMFLPGRSPCVAPLALVLVEVLLGWGMLFT